MVDRNAVETHAVRPYCFSAEQLNTEVCLWHGAGRERTAETNPGGLRERAKAVAGRAPVPVLVKAPATAAHHPRNASSRAGRVLCRGNAVIT